MLITNLHETKNDLLAFYLVTGFRTALFDLDESEIFSCSHELSEFCEMIHKNEKTHVFCKECDKRAFTSANNTGQSHLYGCPFGLYEAVVPLLMDNAVTGYLMIGQMALEAEETTERIEALSLPYFDEELHPKLIESIAKIPRISLEKLYASLSLLEISANHIVKQGWLKPDKETLPSKIKEFIDLHYTKNINIDSICNHTSYSRTYVINAFSKTYNISISKYIEQKRLELALELLSTSSKSVAQIASFCGFNDQYYFSKVCKRVYSKTPTELR